MDLYLFHFLYSFAHRSWLFDQIVIFFADYSGYALIGFFVWLLWKEKNNAKRIYGASLVALAMILSRGIITEIIRLIYEKPRPFVALENVTALVNHSASNAFPSGHATLFFALAFAVWYINKKTGMWFVGIAIAMGVARVIAGAHWPLDIMGGAAVAAVSAFIIRKILPKQAA